MTIKELDANKDQDKFSLIRAFVPALKIFIQNYKMRTQKSTNPTTKSINIINSIGDAQKYSKVAIMRRVEEKLVGFCRRLEERIGLIDFKLQKDGDKYK